MSVMVLLLAGCAAQSGEGQAGVATVSPTSAPAEGPPSEPTPSPSARPSLSSKPSPSPSPSLSGHQSFPPAPEGESEEAAAIREGWEEYERQLDRYMHDSTIEDLSDLVATTTGAESTYVVDQIRIHRDEGVVRIGDLSFRDVEIGAPTQAPDGSKQAVVRLCKDFTAQQLIIESTGEPRRVSGVETADLVRIELTMQQASGGRWVVAVGKSLGKSC